MNSKPLATGKTPIGRGRGRAAALLEQIRLRDIRLGAISEDAEPINNRGEDEGRPGTVEGPIGSSRGRFVGVGQGQPLSPGARITEAPGRGRGITIRERISNLCLGESSAAIGGYDEPDNGRRGYVGRPGSIEGPVGSGRGHFVGGGRRQPLSPGARNTKAALRRMRRRALKDRVRGLHSICSFH